MNNLCNMMLESGKYSNNSDTISKPSLSGEEFDIYNETESLKTGQSVNRDLDRHCQIDIKYGRGNLES